MPRSLAAQLADMLADGGWRAKARPQQLPPSGDWNGWMILAGRGFGKTRTGAEWIREIVETGAASRIALVGPTAADARDVMVEGPAGILAVSSRWCRPEPCAEFSSSTVKATASSCCVPSRNRQATIAR
jgi:phage terminase large subunit-like protein